MAVTKSRTLNIAYLYSDSSYEYPSPYSVGESADYSEGLKPMKPFGMDLDVTSNRSSIISQVNVCVTEFYVGGNISKKKKKKYKIVPMLN
jgi:hypothetical protein